MSQQGTDTTSDYLNFDATLNKAMEMLKSDDKRHIIAFLTIVGINSGLRISDILRLTHSDIKSDVIVINEKKTSKKRIIPVNDNIKEAYKLFAKKVGTATDEEPLFISQKGGVISARQVNRLLQANFSVKGKNVSSHSLRKTFGRRIWSNDGESERSLIQLSQIFNHVSSNITRTYLGIKQQELNNIYMSL